MFCLLMGCDQTISISYTLSFAFKTMIITLWFPISKWIRCSFFSAANFTFETIKGKRIKIKMMQKNYHPHAFVWVNSPFWFIAFVIFFLNFFFFFAAAAANKTLNTKWSRQKFLMGMCIVHNIHLNISLYYSWNVCNKRKTQGKRKLYKRYTKLKTRYRWTERFFLFLFFFSLCFLDMKVYLV